MVGHRVSDHLACRQVDDGRQVPPALDRRQISDVADQFRAGLLGGEVAADQVRGRA